MDEVKFERFLAFLLSEIDRISKQSSIRDNSLVLLSNEITSLKSKLQQSEFPQKLKDSINNLEVKYSANKIEKGMWLTFAFILTLGAWYFIYSYQLQTKRKNYLGNLRHQIAEVQHSFRSNAYDS